MNKIIKAVSPLIATILLVAVALAIAGILYSWSQTYFVYQTDSVTESTQNPVDCAYANIEINDCNYTSANGLTFILNSTGTVNFLKGFKIAALTNTDVKVESSITNTLNAGDFISIKSTNFSNSSSYASLNTPLKRVRVTPIDCPEKYTQVTTCGA